MVLFYLFLLNKHFNINKIIFIYYLLNLNYWFIFIITQFLVVLNHIIVRVITHDFHIVKVDII
ncbi:hypothetical protein XBKB1_4190022 [Xenorhabdus bovienii str. kraussei Becker Underwood]|uniref:Uncharacterized protein n=1 Tax=Xenorhabdus bovienii str. kraussei Becker Underwood TaxID=1398204 RepID=A0A077PYM8_XENBV|nr:hypothetical protein XBKB1_4190022 [Xenorhabdus bovienii str. kraussei Becker Underwood]